MERFDGAARLRYRDRSPLQLFDRLAPELVLMRRPLAGYAALRDSPDEGWRRLLFRVLLMQLAIGTMVSFTAAGRLTVPLVLNAMIAWAFVPVFQILVVTVTYFVLRPRTGLVRALSLHLAGNGPLLLFCLVPSAVVLFPTHVYDAFSFLLDKRILPGIMVAAFVWGGVLSAAYYRVGLGISRWRTALVTFIDVIVKWVLVLAYYLSIDNIVPQFVGKGRLL